MKPFMRSQNPQNTRNYGVIHIINPPIFKSVLKLDQLIPQFDLLLNSKNKALTENNECYCNKQFVFKLT